MKRIFPIIALVISIFIIRLIENLFSTEESSIIDNRSIPPDQRRFLQIITDIKNDSEGTTNDIGKKILIEKRNKELCTFKEINGEGGVSINNWIGKVNQIEAFDSGPSRITISLEKNIILIGAFNNNLNSAASKFRIGDSIRFSGNIFSEYNVNSAHCSSVKEYIKQDYFTKETLAEFDLKEQISTPIFGIEIRGMNLD